VSRSRLAGGILCLSSLGLLLAACGGGGGGSGALPVAPRVVAPLGTISLSIAVPPPAVAARLRMPRYVSSSTYQAAIVVTPQNATALAVQIVACTVPTGGVGKVCAGSLSAPVGIDSVAITLEDQPVAGNTRGTALSQGTTVAVVNQGQSTTIHATLDGIVHNVGVAFAAPTINYAPTLPYSYAAQGKQIVAAYLAVNAYDADGNVITYNGGYVDGSGNNVAISLGASTLCGAALAHCPVALGTSTVSGPGAIVPVTVTLDDQYSAFTESLTVTPSILFGNPGGTLTGGTVAFARPSACSAYLPAPPSLTGTWSDYDLGANGPTLEQFRLDGDPGYFQSLDVRLAYGYVLTAVPYGTVGFMSRYFSGIIFAPAGAAQFSGDTGIVNPPLTPPFPRGTDVLQITPTAGTTLSPGPGTFTLGVFDGLNGLCSDAPTNPVVIPSYYPQQSTLGF
jgi:hypothetical protein